MNDAPSTASTSAMRASSSPSSWSSASGASAASTIRWMPWRRSVTASASRRAACSRMSSSRERLAGPQRPPGAPELDEDGDLRAQDDRVVGLEHVVDRARLVAAEDVVLLLGDRRHEDDRDRARALPALDVVGGLEAVELGHLDVEQDHREIVVEQAL